MYNKIETYRFLLQNGLEYFGKVVAEDDQKLVVVSKTRSAGQRRVIIYHHSVMVAEPLGWDARVAV